ncbi:MAG: type II toxin-antitoxin system HipA family toxin [Deltaproteobacteria bacterium]|nr:type II toxin-antitoxin system HipA family toxin [Deltaproteobacteria bacterium]MBW2342430.1 type II toxin-antitoxin system HipA family toxin [Deltaproteobacteria bacterium]
MEAQVTVFVFLNGGWVPAGRLKYFSRGRQSYSVFAYGKKYLEDPEAVSLDPVQLPLGSGEFHTPDGFEIFNGIRDAGADQWGRYLIDKRFSSTDELDYILATSCDRVGALAFGDDPAQGPKIFSPQGFEPLSHRRFDLGKAAGAIHGVIEDEDTEELKDFLQYGPSLGGTRPKTTVNWQGKPYIAKFSVSHDRRNEPLIEYATMTLTKKCGINVPALDKARVLDRDVFLIQRFDRRYNSKTQTEEPVPFISALTATGVHESDLKSFSYRRLCDAITKLCKEPDKDKEELYRRMVFNILVYNNDDHYRNHGLLYAGKQKWELSPLYDVVPAAVVGESRHLGCAIGPGGNKEATLENAMTSCSYFGLEQVQARQIITSLKSIVGKWQTHFNKCGVPETDIEKLKNSLGLMILPDVGINRRGQ